MPDGATLSSRRWSLQTGVCSQLYSPSGTSQVTHGVKNLPAMQEMQETRVQSLGQEDSPGGGFGNSLQYSCLENPLDRGAWLRRVEHD